LTLLQQAVEFGFSDPQHIDEDDDLDNIRNEPRFREIRALAVELDVPPYPAQARDRTGRLLGEWRAALPRIEAAAQRHPNVGQAWFNLGYAWLALGRPDDSAAAFARAASLSYRPATSTYNLACAFAQAGRRDDAFAALDRAIELGFENRGLLRNDSDLEPLPSDPRWRRY